MPFDIFTPKEFLERIRVIYREAQQIKPLTNSNIPINKITRCRAHSIASYLEDLFAQFLAINFTEDDLHFFVDIPLTFAKGKQPRYPDVLVCRKTGENSYKILYMYDVKTNTGWFRNNIFEFVQEKMAPLLKSIKTANQITAERGKIFFSVADNINYDMVILSEKNNSRKNVYDSVNKINTLEGAIHIWLLTSNEVNEKHMNPKVDGDIIPNSESFSNIYNLLAERAIKS